MANRKFKESVNIFKKSDSICWNDSRDDSMKALTDEYAKDFLVAPDLTRKIIAPTNDDVDKLNLFARGLLMAAGKIGSEVHLETAKGIIPVGTGDRMVMTETVDKKKGLVNGAFGTVTGIKGKEIELKIDTSEGQPVKKFNIRVGKDKDLGEVFGISHGYASTVYKSQGDSIDRTYVFHDHRATAPSNYVALTRHIERVRLFVTREETNSFDELAEQLKHGHDKTAAHSYLLDDEGFAKLDRPAALAGPSLAPELYTEPLEPVHAQKDTLRELFGAEMGEAERGDLKDRTSATIPGLLPPSARKIEEHERGR
jgi:ATP-dependent exoDNAse (exonuclease V) alpha subunit